MSGAPFPPLSITGGPSGPAYADGFLADYGSAFQGGDSFRSDFNVGGSGFMASASGSSSLWKWVVIAVAAVLVARILRK